MVKFSKRIGTYLIIFANTPQRLKKGGWGLKIKIIKLQDKNSKMTKNLLGKRLSFKRMSE